MKITKLQGAKAIKIRKDCEIEKKRDEVAGKSGSGCNIKCRKQEGERDREKSLEVQRVQSENER